MTPLAATEAERLTPDQCDEFRRHPGTFNQMVQAIYDAGRARAMQQTAEPCYHRVADARNPIITSGYICVDCGALFAAADHAAPARAPSTDSAADARDAARYRWLRDPDNVCGPNWLASMSPLELDAAIDTAITPPPETEEEPRTHERRRFER